MVARCSPCLEQHQHGGQQDLVLTGYHKARQLRQLKVNDGQGVCTRGWGRHSNKGVWPCEHSPSGVQLGGESLLRLRCC